MAESHRNRWPTIARNKHAGDADKDKHIHAAEVHPHPVRDYAAQSVEPQTHVYGTVVEPVAVTIVKAEHSCEIRS